MGTGSFKPWSKLIKLVIFNKFVQRDSYRVGGKSGTAHQPTPIKLNEKYILRIFIHQKANFFLQVHFGCSFGCTSNNLVSQSDNNVDNYIISQNPNDL